MSTFLKSDLMRKGVTVVVCVSPVFSVAQVRGREMTGHRSYLRPTFRLSNEAKTLGSATSQQSATLAPNLH